MSDKAKFLWSALISYSTLIFVLLPISLLIQGSKAHEAFVFVMVTVLFSMPVALGVATFGYRIFTFIRGRIEFNKYVSVFFGAAGVAFVLSGLANIVSFFVVGKISSDMSGFFLYPTLIVSALAAFVYLGFEKWS